MAIRERQKDGRFLGVLSLNNVTKTQADFTILIGEFPRDNPLVALEATSILVEYSFETLGLKRVNGGSRVSSLIGFVDRLQLLGFSFEGLKEDSWYRNGELEATLHYGLTKSDYAQLKLLRGGSIWRGLDEMMRLVSGLKNQNHEQGSFTSSFIEILRKQRNLQKKTIQELELETLAD